MGKYLATVSTDPLNVDLTEMSLLAQGLTKRGIGFTYRRLYDGAQILVGDEWDAIIHNSSYGHDSGLLEIMGTLVDEESVDDSVEEWLSASQILERVDKMNAK